MTVYTEGTSGAFMPQPRAFTEAEVQKLVLSHCRAIAKSWARDPNRSKLEACEGAVFSVLSMLAGCNATLPQMSLLLEPHVEDKPYCIANDSNWFEPGMRLETGSLHAQFFKS